MDELTRVKLLRTSILGHHVMDKLIEGHDQNDHDYPEFLQQAILSPVTLTSFVLTRRKISSPLRTLDRFNRVALHSVMRLSPAVRCCSASSFPLVAEDLALVANISAPVADVRLSSWSEVAGGIKFRSGTLVATGRLKSRPEVSDTASSLVSPS